MSINFLVVVLAVLIACSTNCAQAFTLETCQSTCKFSLTESIPEGLTYVDGKVHQSTFSVWIDLLAKATSTVEIASYYWSLRDGILDKFPSGDQGQKVYDELLMAGTRRKLTVKIAQSLASDSLSNIDTQILEHEGAAQVRNLNFTRLVGSGILHTKMWLIDRKHAYIGSANTDWRSLTQVKEMGVYVQDCPCIGEDVGKLFDVYWNMGAPDAVVPSSWSKSLSTDYNMDSPMNLSPAGLGLVYLSSSPPSFCPSGRTGDITAITSTIAKAKKFIYVANMDYLPLYLYTGKHKYWGVLDTALKSAAIGNDVEVRMLIGWWTQSQENQKRYLQSLVAIADNTTIKISARLFVVPTSKEQSKIPYSRVNHAKFMVTDSTAYIGTSNWSADYFTDTAGVGVVIEGDTKIRQQLEDAFLRDWNSEFTFNLTQVSSMKR